MMAIKTRATAAATPAKLQFAVMGIDALIGSKVSRAMRPATTETLAMMMAVRRRARSLAAATGSCGAESKIVMTVMTTI